MRWQDDPATRLRRLEGHLEAVQAELSCELAEARRLAQASARRDAVLAVIFAAIGAALGAGWALWWLM